MADVYTLVIGAFGGLAALIGKYVIDRFAEAHKTALGVAAKRSEAFNERQALVIAGLYRRLVRCVADLSKLYFHGDEASLEPEISKVVEKQSDANLTKATRSFQKLESFYDKYNLYLPEPLDQSVLTVVLLAERHIDDFESAFLQGVDQLKDSVVEDISDIRAKNITLLLDLKREFRQLLVDEAKPELITCLRAHWPSGRVFSFERAKENNSPLGAPRM